MTVLKPCSMKHGRSSRVLERVDFLRFLHPHKNHQILAILTLQIPRPLHQHHPPRPTAAELHHQLQHRTLLTRPRQTEPILRFHTLVQATPLQLLQLTQRRHHIQSIRRLLLLLTQNLRLHWNGLTIQPYSDEIPEKQSYKLLA
jgi:hypothetical protein